jgi:hypothetical protein
MAQMNRLSRLFGQSTREGLPYFEPIVRRGRTGCAGLFAEFGRELFVVFQ